VDLFAYETKHWVKPRWDVLKDVVLDVGREGGQEGRITLDKGQSLWLWVLAFSAAPTHEQKKMHLMVM
jgi:hypothetical protein